MRKHLVAVTTGPDPVANMAATFHLRLPSPAIDPDQVAEAFRDSGISPSDVRTSVSLHLPSGTDPETAVCAYVGLVGYLRRRPDRVVVDEQSLSLSTVSRQLRDSFAGLPILTGHPVHIGDREVLREGVEMIATDKPWSEHECSQIRNATVVWWPLPANVVAALTQLVLLSAVRAAPPKERFPTMLNGQAELDLDAVRKACSDLRSASTYEDRSTVVPPVEMSSRARRLQQAADTDAGLVLQRLGMTELVCPRAARHTRPAEQLVIDGHKVECSVCDPYPVDALRLVMDTTGMVADDAAAWILGETPTMSAAGRLLAV